ncbi:hypothetical protein ACZ90_14745 [Streptomyces albus subsp. albus]|nr:hypothetical protein ACZ90_14745 [Streptomyces albus subsp. albus]
MGFGAIAAALPYFVLKLIWICGGTLGIIDHERARDSLLFVMNIVTLGMDAIAVTTALALTQRWGLRLPAPLVLFPMWLASGLLAPIVAIAPLLPLFTADSVDRDPDPFLSPWVYLVVYGGFALQGVLLAAAFTLYTRVRWAPLWTARNDGGPRGADRGPGHAVAAPLAAVAGVIAIGVAAVYLSWACGSTAGMPPALVAERGGTQYLVHASHGVFALLAAVGVAGLVHRRPRRRPVWIPVAATWLGAGAMFGWGCWMLVTLGHKFADDRPGQLVLFTLTVTAQIVTGLLIAVTAAFTVTERFGQVNQG